MCRTRNKTFGTRSLQMSICCLLVVQMLFLYHPWAFVSFGPEHGKQDRDSAGWNEVSKAKPFIWWRFCFVLRFSIIYICKEKGKQGSLAISKLMCCGLIVQVWDDMDEYSINNVWVVYHSGSHTVLFVLLNCFFWVESNSSCHDREDKWLLYTAGKSYGSCVTEGCSVEEHQSRWAMIRKQDC